MVLVVCVAVMVIISIYLGDEVKPGVLVLAVIVCSYSNTRSATQRTLPLVATKVIE